MIGFSIGIGVGGGGRLRFLPSAIFTASEPGAWYDPSDLTTLFQDSAGATPVTTAGQTVGKMLDKSQGLVLGSELVTNGDFTDPVTTGWTASGSAVLSVVSGRLRVTNGATLTGGATYVFSTVAGRSYKWTYFVDAATSGGVVVRARDNTTLTVLQTATFTTSGSYSVIFVAQGSTTQIQGVNTSNTLGIYHEFDNISVRELPGNHATQATLAQRPTYGINPITGTRNLLTFTEQFDNAAWVKSNATITANTAVAPDETTTADSILDTAVSNIHYCAQSMTALFPSGKTYTVSAYGKANTLNYMTLGISDISSGSLYAIAVFNLSTGAVSTSGAAGTGYSVVSSSISSVGSGWYRCVVTVVAGTSVSFLRAVVAPNKAGTITAAAGGMQSYLGDGSGFYAWGAQLEESATATAYQKVVSQYEVTEAGIASASYIAFDGVDDGMVTGTITPGIDKVQVFAGIRRISDANTGILAEFSPAVASNAGSWHMLSPAGGGTAGSGFASKGTVAAANNTVSPAAPITEILTGIGDIAGDVNTFRKNGVATSVLTDQGTGNFLPYVLYIGRRNGASLAVNSRIYSLIVRFGANLTAGQIASTENYVNGKTGAY